MEMGDCILHILDYLAEAEVDISAVIGFTPASKDLFETLAMCHNHISRAYIQTTSLDGSADCAHDRLLSCMETILDWARLNDVDMEAVLRAKHEYNVRACPLFEAD